MKLVDGLGRVHDYLRISLIDKCNLRCTYCMPENPLFLSRDQLMTSAELLELAGIFVQEMGVRKIRLTGGEPLLRPDFREVLVGLAGLEVDLAITTNGILLETYLKDLRAAGIRSLNISLDTLRPDRFWQLTRRQGLETVRTNIDRALDQGFRVKVNAVAMKGINEDEILDFVAWTREVPVHVRFIEFMPFDGNRWEWNKVLSYQEMLDTIQAQFEVEKLEDGAHSTSKAYRVPGHKGTFAVISTVTDAFCRGCNRLRLTAEGKLRNCLFAKAETDLLSALRGGQDVRSLITTNLAAKHAQIGGLPEFEDAAALRENLSNRAMVSIGG